MVLLSFQLLTSLEHVNTTFSLRRLPDGHIKSNKVDNKAFIDKIVFLQIDTIFFCAEHEIPTSTEHLNQIIITLSGIVAHFAG